MTVTIQRTYDPELIGSVIFHPEIFATIGEDDAEMLDWFPDVETEAWLEVVIGNELIGVYNITAVNHICAEIHAQILPEHRKMHSKESGRLALKWIIDNEPQYQKVIANIPTLFPNVIKFTMNCCFQYEGTNRLAYLKNDELHDIIMLGITKQEIMAFLDEKQ